jgi:hypothetical protein
VSFIFSVALCVDVGEPRRALFHVGAHRLALIGSAHQLHLLRRFGEQCRTRIDREIIEHPFGGADRLRTFAGDFTRDFERCSERILADSRSEAIAHRLLRRENAPGIRQLA